MRAGGTWTDFRAVQSTATGNEVLAEEDDQNIRQHGDFQRIEANSRFILRYRNEGTGSDAFACRVKTAYSLEKLGS
jgi:hypothetical protein